MIVSVATFSGNLDKWGNSKHRQRKVRKKFRSWEKSCGFSCRQNKTFPQVIGTIILSSRGVLQFTSIVRGNFLFPVFCWKIGFCLLSVNNRVVLVLAISFVPNSVVNRFFSHFGLWCGAHYSHLLTLPQVWRWNMRVIQYVCYLSHFIVMRSILMVKISVSRLL